MKCFKFLSLLIVFSMVFSTTFVVSSETSEEYFTKYTDTSNLSALCEVALSTADNTDPKWSSYRFLAQECVPKEDIRGVKLYFALNGKATFHIEIRKTVNGSALSSVNQKVSGTGNPAWYFFSLDSVVNVTPGESYYIVYYLTSRDAGGSCLQSAYRPTGEMVKYPAYTSYMAQNKTDTDLTSKRAAILPFQLETAYTSFEKTTELDYLCNVALPSATQSDPYWDNYCYMAQRFVAHDSICGVELYLEIMGTVTLNLEVRSALNSGKVAETTATFTGTGEKEWFSLRMDKVILQTAHVYYLVWYTSSVSNGGYCKEYSYTHPSIGNCVATSAMSKGGSAASLTEIKSTCVPFKVIDYSAEYLEYTDSDNLSDLCFLASVGATSENCEFCNSCRYVGQEFVPGSDDFRGIDLLLSLNGSAKIHFELRQSVNSSTPLAIVEKTVTGTGTSRWYRFIPESKVAVKRGEHYFAVWYLTSEQYAVKVTQPCHRLTTGTSVYSGYTSLLAEKGTPTTLKSKGLVVLPFKVISSRDAFTSFDAGDCESQLCDVYVKGKTNTDPLWTSYRYIGQEFVPDDGNLSGFKVFLALNGTATIHLEIREEPNGSAIETVESYITGKGENARFDIAFRENLRVVPYTAYYAVWYLTKLSDGGSCKQMCHRYNGNGQSVFPVYTSYPASEGTEYSLSTKGTAVVPFGLITNFCTTIYGDVDYNGEVNAVDSLFTLRNSIGLCSVGYRQFSQADVDYNNKIQSVDALLVLRKSIEMIDKFPVEEKPGKDSKEHNRYLEIMNTALSAYTQQDIIDYLNTVKADGITEHGFGRLTANMGILIAHGYRPEYKDLFREMMDICCAQMPFCMPIAKSKGESAGNDFALKEICFALLELDNCDVFNQRIINKWRSDLSKVNPKTCYNCISPTPPQNVGNWASYNSSSEVLRSVAGLGEDKAFLDNQLASILLSFDENGMYIDPDAPMLYDLAARQQVAICLFCGYDGACKDALWEQMLKSADDTLYMQSSAGEIAYGGRSNQFIFNEAIQTSLFEFYANYFNSQGNSVKAGEYKKAAQLSTDSIEYWLGNGSFITHVKNNFKTEDKYGYEGYAYFNKYMITVASFIYVAYLFSDKSIATGNSCPALNGKYVHNTSETFHKNFMGYKGYTTEIDYKAYTNYDATGLGRIHKNGAPPAICLSLPGGLAINMGTYAKRLFSISPGMTVGSTNYFGYDADAVWTLTSQETTETYVKTSWNVTLTNGKVLLFTVKISDNGVDLSVTGSGNISLCLPAFEFDGENHTVINAASNRVSVEYQGWNCVYTTANSTMTKSNAVYPTRNGVYNRYNATGNDFISVNVKIDKIK